MTNGSTSFPKAISQLVRFLSVKSIAESNDASPELQIQSREIDSARERCRDQVLLTGIISPQVCGAPPAPRQDLQWSSPSLRPRRESGYAPSVRPRDGTRG